jgi:hypothetical protein
MRVEYLYLSEGRMTDNNMGGTFANEPISSNDIQRVTIEGIRIHPRLQDRITSEYCQACTKRPTSDCSESGHINVRGESKVNLPIEELCMRKFTRYPLAYPFVMGENPYFLQSNDVVR